MTSSPDTGYLGPAAVTWPILSHPGALIGGLRALLIQSLHPLAMAGVAQHSDYRTRALSRLQRTAAYVGATAFGTVETADEAAARVRRMHQRVRGVDPVTGKAYSADDPETQVWVHAVEWHSFLAAHRAFGPQLTPDEEDAYLAEGVVIAALVGAREEDVPASVAQMREYFASVRPSLCVSSAARDSISFVSSPPITRELLPVQLPLRVFSSAAIALVPRDLRRLAGIDRPAAVDVAAIAMARPWLELMRTPIGARLATSVIGGRSRAPRDRAEAAHGEMTVAAMRDRRAELGITGPGITRRPTRLREAAAA
ncbi:DUF2236 domain-containing protein [Svornostia abyssi]|uniref:DUF2236 domain-containing protein n=1 Tax=Svornostia abyssi TaxID=2898438 RepID=A0ABY5PCC8_9ACTN|nr:DUF2236 domain-containing protein [Parviterribacteraceae bacterium J379]